MNKEKREKRQINERLKTHLKSKRHVIKCSTRKQRAGQKRKARETNNYK